MSAVDPVEEARRWFRYAQEDLTAAEAMLGENDVAPRHVCWLAQQAAEKALKAVLVFLQIDFPKTHDLDALRNLIPEDWPLKKNQPDLASLTEWAVEARYPGDWPEAVETDARSAIEHARAVWRSVQNDLASRGFGVID